MRSSRLPRESKRNECHYTHLFARISEEDDGYIIVVRLYNKMISQNVAWGEEIADSFETASSLVAALAANFSIVEECITIDIRMCDLANGTRH